jgi:hypothetical protein
MTWRVLGALILIGLGVLFLLVNLGLIPPNAWRSVLPALLILAGIGLILSRRRAGRQVPTVQESAPLDGASEAIVMLKHGAGLLTVHAANDPSLLFVGSFAGRIEKKVTREGGTAILELKGPMEVWDTSVVGSARGLTWDVALNATIPIELKYEGGAAETNMDLSQLWCKSVDINTGASSTDVILPAPRGTLRVQVQSGAASVKLRLPPSAPAAIIGSMSLGSLQIDSVRFPISSDGEHRSVDYDAADDRIQIRVEGGVGSVEVR